jgi:hypothetical protein
MTESFYEYKLRKEKERLAKGDPFVVRTAKKAGKLTKSVLTFPFKVVKTGYRVANVVVPEAASFYTDYQTHREENILNERAQRLGVNPERLKKGLQAVGYMQQRIEEGEECYLTPESRVYLNEIREKINSIPISPETWQKKAGRIAKTYWIRKSKERLAYQAAAA